MSQLFEFTSYIPYLKSAFSGKGEGRGKRSLLAKHLNCQTSFISQVLTDRAHLSLEYSIKVTEYLNFSQEEQDYFMLLVQKDKSGSTALEEFYLEKIQLIKKDRKEIKQRIKVEDELSEKDQLHYYSTWHYAAIHILTALPGFDTAEDISKKLKLDIKNTKQVLSFLEDRGFVTNESGKYSIASRRIHLTKGSAMLPRHHANWRMMAIESVNFEKKDDLHYSAIIGIAKNDIPLFKEKFLKLTEEFEPIINESPAEVPVVVLCDLFEL